MPSVANQTVNNDHATQEEVTAGYLLLRNGIMGKKRKDKTRSPDFYQFQQKQRCFHKPDQQKQVMRSF